MGGARVDLFFGLRRRRRPKSISTLSLPSLQNYNHSSSLMWRAGERDAAGQAPPRIPSVPYGILVPPMQPLAMVDGHDSGMDGRILPLGLA